MAKQFAKSGDPDQTLRSAASDRGLHCLPITLLNVTRPVLHNLSMLILSLFNFGSVLHREL